MKTKPGNKRNIHQILLQLILGATALLSLGISVSPSVHAAEISESRARDFIEALYRNSLRLTEFIDTTELKLCARLGIQYDEEDVKFLISQDLDSLIKIALISGQYKYLVDTSPLNDSFQKVTLSVPNVQHSRDFYFKGGQWILPSTYFSRNWRRFESEHFRFIVSDSCMMLPNCADDLEHFFKTTAALLGYTEKQLETIRRNKIEYLLCRDSKEVSMLTGYENRGMYELPSDRIITCYHAHYHELVHLMVNFKLQQLPLWTHPLLQEGIAVALGGRGGLAPPVVAEMAAYLVESGMASVSDLMSVEGFNQVHNTINYPVSGLYCKFLLEQIGAEQFFKLYRKYSGSSSQLRKMNIVSTDIPNDSLWSDFVTETSLEHLIDLNETDSGFVEVYRDSALVVAENGQKLMFQVRGKALIGGNEKYASYRNAAITESFGGMNYGGEKYGILADSSEIKIYNLYTGNLIANVVSTFCIPSESVPYDGRYFRFVTDRGIFDRDFIQMLKGANQSEE